MVIEEFNPSSALSRVEPGEQGGTGGGAFRVVVELPKPQAIGRHFIEIGGLDDVSSIGPDVGPSHVVDHDQDDVGLLLGVNDESKCRQGKSEWQFHGAFRKGKYGGTRRFLSSSTSQFGCSGQLHP